MTDRGPRLYDLGMTTLRIEVHGLPDRGLKRLADGASDLRPFWRQLGERLADTAQSRWPLRRRTGRLRKSLTWAGDRLGKGGVYESDPDRLTFGSSVFYARFHQAGARNLPRRPLIHIHPEQHTEQLSAWLRARAGRAGLEVTP